MLPTLATLMLVAPAVAAAESVVVDDWVPPPLLVWRTQFAPPSVVVMIGGSALGYCAPAPFGTTYRPEAAQVFASEHEIDIRPANGFGPPVPGTPVPGVVIGVVCQVQLAPPSDVLRTWA